MNAGAPDITDRQDAVLAELLEIGMVAAREVQARLLAAEEAKELCELSLALGRLSRSVRQTVALQARLGRERRRQAREDAAEATEAEEARAARRKAQVRAAVERAIYAEADGDEAEGLALELDDRFTEAELDDGFVEAPVAAQIEHLCAALGVAPPAAPASPGDDAAAVADGTSVPPPPATVADPPGSQPDGSRPGGASGASALPDHPWISSA